MAEKKIKNWNVVMVPPDGEQQTIEGTDAAGNKVERKIFRDGIVGGRTEEEARLQADKSAIDIAVQYGSPRYVIESIEEIDE